jgi:Kef-type K+ transport system membrane component KefB
MTSKISGLTHEDVFSVLLQLSFLLFAARSVGALFVRFGQPSVIGEILAGVLIGPSFLSSLFPQVGSLVLPTTSAQQHALDIIGLFGVLFLLLVTGMEIDFGLIKRHSKTALGVALGGLVVPLIMGFALGFLLPEAMHGIKGKGVVFSLFLAIGLSISAIPVLAKVLFELDLFRRNLGQTILAAAMIDDAVAWILLSVLVAMAKGEDVTFLSVFISIAKVLGIGVITLFIIRPLAKNLFRLSERRLDVESIQLSMCVVLMLAWAAFSHFLGLEALLGAFLVGIILRDVPSLVSPVVHTLEMFALRIFAPIFFALAGLKVYLFNLSDPQVFFATIAIFLTAVICKTLGVYLGGVYLAKLPPTTALFYGAGLNARGSMEMVLAALCLSLGIISTNMYTSVVVMAVLTSVIAPPLMKLAESKIPKDASEEERLLREAREKKSLIAKARRILVPIRLRLDRNADFLFIEVLMLNMLAEEQNVDITFFSVIDAEEQSPANEFLSLVSDYLPNARINKIVITSNDVAGAILDESRKGYDFIFMGAPENSSKGADNLFTPTVDEVLRLAPCPVVLIKGIKNNIKEGVNKRILIPITGSTASLTSTDFSFSLFKKVTKDFFLLKIIEANEDSLQKNYLLRQLEFSREMLKQLADDAQSRSLEVKYRVIIDEDPSEVILNFVKDYAIDILVLGTNVRVGGSKLYLGPRVERLIRESSSAVVIVNS